MTKRERLYHIKNKDVKLFFKHFGKHINTNIKFVPSTDKDYDAAKANIALFDEFTQYQLP